MYRLQENSLGAQGENWAKKYLLKKGYVILAANYTNSSGHRLGEIDIIAQKNGIIVFIEVKTRLVNANTEIVIIPEENITRSKLVKMRKMAEYFLRSKQQLDANYQFDALSVLYQPQEKKVSIRHIENIFYS
jgi:putative endonuclease